MTNPNAIVPHVDGRRKRGKRAAVFTSTPDVDAPVLTCPMCDRMLVYRETVISGVKPIERWERVATERLLNAFTHLGEVEVEDLQTKSFFRGEVIGE